MELTILIVVLFLGVGIPCGIRDIKSGKRNEKIKMEKDLRDMIAFLDDCFNKAKGDRE